MCKEPENVPGRSKTRISIIGAGPAGLAAAGFLACKGYNIIIYDKQPLAGGLMVFAIPKIRIRDETVFVGVDELRDKFGIEFKFATKVFADPTPRKDEGEELVRENVPLKEIIENSDAVMITTGTWRSRRLGLPGEEGPGVMSALDFLYAIRLYEKGLTSHKPRIGRRVVVIGAGLSAVDAAMEAWDRGAQEVIIAYRRTIKQAPAGVYEINQLIRKGIKWIELASPLEIIRENGVVKAIKLQRMRLGEPDASGRPRPIPIPGSEFTLKADTVILAVGELATPPFEKENLGITVDRKGRIQVDQYYRTANPKVWAAGDVVTGPSFIGNAVKTALYAAKAVHLHLSGKKLLY